VFRDESGHINFAFEVISTVRREDPSLFDLELQEKIAEMMKEAVDVEMAFAEDVLSMGVAGMSSKDMRRYLEYVADRRLVSLGIHPIFEAKNPFAFMELQDVQELSNFFERRVSSYQVGVSGDVAFGEDF
jgi:ribonucleoside-diphosphate reductase beta chain